MKEYLVHIEIEDKNSSHTLVFRSTTLTNLFLAIDDFRNTLSNVSDRSILNDTESALQSLTTNFESQFSLVDEDDQMDEDGASATVPKRTEPLLKISYPGAE